MNSFSENHIGHFLDHGDGTVTDTRTGLMWMRAAEGQRWGYPEVVPGLRSMLTGSFGRQSSASKTCSGRGHRFTFIEAMTIRRDFAGHADWRLPTIEELKSLSSTQLSNQAFPNPPEGYFWSSTRQEDSGSRHDGWPYIITLGRTLGVGNPQTSAEYVRLVRGGMSSGFESTAATGKLQQIETRRAIPTESASTIPVITNSAKELAASLSSRLFPVNVMTTGTGTGTITRNPEADSYYQGDVVSLTACAEVGSKFNGWDGDVKGWHAVCNVRMNSAKTISAEFVRIESFALNVTTTGTGSGTITRSIEAESYPNGNTIMLSACAENGSIFKGWRGDANGLGAHCTVTMDSAKTILAEFVRIESFALSVTTTGTGSGTITRNVEADSYLQGSTVTLTAWAAEGSIFNGWRGDGDVLGLDADYSVMFDSAKSVTAEFARLDLPDLGIGIAFASVEDATTRYGEKAFVFYLSIANKGQKLIRIELPPCSYYVTCHGEEIEQDNYAELITGKESTIRAGTFRKTELWFFRPKLNEISTGDHLYVTVVQAKPARRLHFSFRCTDQKSRVFTLTQASSEDVQVPDEVIESSLEKLEILQRIVMLEKGLSDVLQKLDAMQVAPALFNGNTSTRNTPAQTLPEVLTWLATHARISVAALRIQLLPLDLLPSAVIDGLNERALDLTGEPAFEEIGDEIVVAREILNEVLANWETSQP